MLKLLYLARNMRLTSTLMEVWCRTTAIECPDWFVLVFLHVIVVQ